MWRNNKYRAVKTYSELCQRTFDSKAEAKRGEELALLEKAGEISDLQYQVKRILSTETHYRVTITIDFSYRRDGKRIYEDVKGMMLKDFKVKLAWLRQMYGIEVNIIK